MASQSLRPTISSSLQRRLLTKQPYRCLSCTLRLSQSAASTSPSTPLPSSSSNAPPQSTHFGYETLPTSEKPSRVNSVFTSVATSYDTMNDLMSLGIHRLWKDYFVRTLDPGSPSPLSPPQTILDVAGGTGDIALRLLSYMENVHGDTRSSVTISDINPAMLAEGRKRVADSAFAPSLTKNAPSASTSAQNPPPRISFLEADGHTFDTIADRSIDLYTIAFGIRNFTSPSQALATAFRILKPGGVFACLEFTPRLSNPVLNGLYKRWSFGGIPLIGQLVAGDRDSYQYLVESIERFPDQRTFEGMIKGAGFVVPRAEGGRGEGGEGEGKGWIDLTGGVAAIHRGVKPV